MRGLAERTLQVFPEQKSSLGLRLSAVSVTGPKLCLITDTSSLFADMEERGILCTL